MPNYDYANSAGLTALSERTFEKIKKEITTDVVTSEAENPLVIETAAAQTAKSTVINIEPIQDLHGYDHPWPAGGGKNLIDSSSPVRAINMSSLAGVFTNTATDTKNFFRFAIQLYRGTTYIEASQYIDVYSPGRYSVTINNTHSDIDRVFVKHNGTTTDIGVHFECNKTGNVTCSITVVSADPSTIGGLVFKDVQIEEGSAATAYAPYSNVCPISGLDEVTVERTGFNLWDEEWEVGDINATTGEDQSGSTIRSINYIPVVSGEVYYIPNPDVARVCAYDAKKNFVSTLEFPSGRCEIPNNVSFIRFRTQIAYGTVYNNDLCINIFDLNKNGTYEPYQKFSAEVPLPTTVYGGTLNLETGELVCDYGMVDLGTLTWTYKSNYLTFEATLSNSKTGVYREVANILCEQYASMSHAALDASSYGCAIGSSTTTLIVKDASYTDAATFKTAMSGMQLAYELANHITCHLTPAQLDLLKGTNVITVNGKTIQVTYREGSLATLEEVNEVGNALVNEECISEESNTVTIKTDAAQYAKKTHLTIEPVQDLHGYDHPWPAGGGKNKLNNTLATTTINGITWTLQSDGTVIANGTATGQSQYQVPFSGLSGDYYFNGCPSGGGLDSTYDVYAWDSVASARYKKWDGTSPSSSDIGPYVSQEIKIPEGHNGAIICRIYQGYVANNLHFKPMIRLSTESDATFEPYSNICPITPMGHRNLLQVTEQSLTHNGVVFTINDDGTIIANGTASSPVTLPIGIADGGNYIVTGCDAGGESTYGLRIGTGSNNTYHGRQHNGSDYYINTQESITVSIYAYSGQVLNNVIFKPMLRSAFDPDSTFVPYGMARVGAKVTGKNLIDVNSSDLISAYIDNVGNINANGDWSTSFYLPVLAGTEYTLSGLTSHPNTGQDHFLQYDKNWNLISKKTIVNNAYPVVFDSGTAYVRFCWKKTDKNAVQFELGSTATDYEPYTEYTSSLDLPEPVYSGTLDLETGEVVADRGSVNVSSSWSWVKSSNFPGGFYVNIWEIGTGQKLDTPFICSHTKTATSIYQYNQGTCFCDGSINIRIMDDSDTVQDWKDYINAQSTAGTPIQICYELKTPITYQLTPQQLALFKGINNISTNAKTVQVTYRNGELATTGNIVDAVEVAKQNAIGESASYTDARLATELAPILGNLATAETSPAIASHAVGEYLLYNKHLCKVLTAISAGQQLTIGTNIGQTNVAAELASAISVLNSKTKQNAWGTTLDITAEGTINGILLIGDMYLVRVWMPSTHDVNITVETAQGSYRKTGTDTVSFGSTSTDTDYTLTRTGVRSFTVTAAASMTLTWIGY